MRLSIFFFEIFNNYQKIYSKFVYIRYGFTGTGMDLPLLSWLEKYTFPYEAMFKNLECARNIYAKCIRRHLRNGSTTVCFYGTIHLEATKLLADLVHLSGNYNLFIKIY